KVPLCIPYLCELCFGIGYWQSFEAWKTFTVSIPDELAPTTTHLLTGTKGCGNWYTSEVQVSLDAQDDISGVAQTVYRIDGSPWIPYYLGDLIPFTVEGQFELEYNSTDNVGNVEETTSVPVKIDWTAPETTIDPVGTAGGVEWYTSYLTVTLTPEDPLPGSGTGSGIEYTKYRINGGDWETGTSFSLSVDGAYFIEFYSKDNACNTEGIKSTTIRIDTHAPTTASTISPYYLDGFGTTYVTCDTTFTLSANDLVPGIDTVSGVDYTNYRINSGPWVLWTGPFEITGPDGTYIIEYYSVDIAGNVEQPTHSLIVELVSLSVTSYLTDSSFNPITFFNFIVHNEKNTGYYKLIATNPGQFYYNIEINNNWPITVDTLVINPMIPEHFVLKGANPIHVYLDGVDVTALCTIENPSITILNVPSESQVYITIHLDYGLKQTYFNSLEELPMNHYVFSASIIGESGSIAIPSEGLFGTYGSSANLIPHQKKTTAIAGYVKDIDGNPIIGATVALLDSEGNPVYSVETDECGFYYFVDIESGEYTVTVNYNSDISEPVVALYRELTLLDIIINGP
ncbi:MAG: carboxypeptidase-like regulatory domain-containing protein, partial [Candidatus Thorarchaeota archaeon]